MIDPESIGIGIVIGFLIFPGLSVGTDLYHNTAYHRKKMDLVYAQQFRDEMIRRGHDPMIVDLMWREKIGDLNDR